MPYLNDLSSIRLHSLYFLYLAVILFLNELPHFCKCKFKFVVKSWELCARILAHSSCANARTLSEISLCLCFLSASSKISVDVTTNLKIVQPVHVVYPGLTHVIIYL